MNAAYLTYLINLVALFFVLAVSYNLLAGFTGLGNLGHPAFFLVGAYTTVLLQMKLSLPVPIAWAGGALAGLITGGFLSLLTKRSSIKGDAVPVMTLLFLVSIVAVALNWTDLTRGALGIPGIPRPGPFSSPGSFLVLSLLVAGAVYLFLHRLTSSPFGRVLGAIRDDELAAATLGKNPFKVRVISFLVAGALGGLGGGLFAYFYRFIDPGSFYLLMLIWILSINYVGGLAAVEGTVVGAILLVLLFEAMRFLPFNPEVVGALRQLTFSVLVILVILFRPRGILGKVEL